MQRSWTLRGFENALTDILLNQDFYDALLDHILDIHLQLVERLSALPVDGILLSDNWGEQRGVIMGPRLWRRFTKPRAARFNTAVHAGGKWTFQHCCGNVTDILPEMIEIGPGCARIRPARSHGRLCPQAPLRARAAPVGRAGTQRLIPFGTPAEIRAEIARLRRELGREGGYILAPQIRLTADSGFGITVGDLYGQSYFFGRIERIGFEAVMLPDRSWWNPKIQANMRGYVLQHEQIHFALTELAAWQLTKDSQKWAAAVLVDRADAARGASGIGPADQG